MNWKSRFVLCVAAACSLGVCVSAAGENAPALSFSGQSAELTMHRKSGRLLVQVHIGEAGPYDFLIDTGAGVSVVDATIAASLGLEVVDQTEVHAPGGDSVPVDVVSAPGLRVGSVRIEGAKPISMNIGEMTSGLIQGVLGMDLFQDVVLTLDATAARAIVTRGELTPGGPGVVAVDGTDGRMKFDLDVAGTKISAQIDTGAPGGFTLPIEQMEGLPFFSEPERRGEARLVGGTRTIRRRRLDGTIRFSGLKYENPDVAFMEPSPGTANIGSAILNELVIAIDARNGLIAFRPAKSAKLEPQRREGPRRLGVRFRGAGMQEIAGVDGGSLGESVGFRAGDFVVSLNGQPMSAYDRATLGALIRGDTPLIWEIERDGERHVIEVD